jgi:hypothetical protein
MFFEFKFIGWLGPVNHVDHAQLIVPGMRSRRNEDRKPLIWWVFLRRSDEPKLNGALLCPSHQGELVMGPIERRHEASHARHQLAAIGGGGRPLRNASHRGWNP